LETSVFDQHFKKIKIWIFVVLFQIGAG
jgi:hypothetical protein